MAHKKCLLSTLLILFVVVATGCSEITRIKVIGNWEADLAEANVGTFGINTQPSDNPFRNVVNSVIKNTAQGITGTVNAKESIKLNHDGSFAASMSVQGKEVSSAEGTWDVADSTGDKVTIRLTHSQTNVNQEITVRMIGGDQFETTSVFGATGGKPATFRRVGSS